MLVLNIVNYGYLASCVAHYFTDQKANHLIFLYVIYFYYSLVMVIFLKCIMTTITEKSVYYMSSCMGKEVEGD